MNDLISTACECLGAVGIAVAVGFLLGAWVGVLVGSFELVGLGYLLGRPEPEANDE